MLFSYLFSSCLSFLLTLFPESEFFTLLNLMFLFEVFSFKV